MENSCHVEMPPFFFNKKGRERELLQKVDVPHEVLLGTVLYNGDLYNTVK